MWGRRYYAGKIKETKQQLFNPTFPDADVQLWCGIPSQLQKRERKSPERREEIPAKVTVLKGQGTAVRDPLKSLLPTIARFGEY